MLPSFSCLQECDASVHVAVPAGSATETSPLRRPRNCSCAVVLLLHHSHSPLPWHCRAGGAFRAGGCVWNELFSQCPLSGLQWDYADLRLSVLLSWFKTVLNQETKTAFKGILKEFNIRKGFFFAWYSHLVGTGHSQICSWHLRERSCVSSCTYLFGILSEIFQCRQFFN